MKIKRRKKLNKKRRSQLNHQQKQQQQQKKKRNKTVRRMKKSHPLRLFLKWICIVKPVLEKSLEPLEGSRVSFSETM